MPTYSYLCTQCGHAFDAQQSFTDDALTTCPECSGRLRKVFGNVGVVFKGSGFYRNDARKDAKGGSSSSSSTAAAKKNGTSSAGPDGGSGTAVSSTGSSGTNGTGSGSSGDGSATTTTSSTAPVATKS